MHHLSRVPILLVAAAAVVGFAGAALYAQENPSHPPPTASGQGGTPALSQLEGDVAVLSLLKRVGFTADQAKAAAGIVGGYASTASTSQAAVQAKLAESEALLSSMRESLLLGTQPDAQTVATYAALRRELAKARTETIRARAEAVGALEALLTPAQREMLQARGPAGRGAQRPGGQATGQFLKVIRQWSDDDYTQRKADIVRRIVGPDVPAEKSERAAALLDRVRALSAEGFQAQQQALTTELAELSPGQRLDVGRLGGRGAPGPGGRRGGGLAGPPPNGGGANGDPFGARPGRGGPLDGNGPAGGGPGLRPGGRGAALVAVRRLPDDQYKAQRPRLVDQTVERTSIPPTDANKEQVGKLLDQVRALPDDELRAKLPEIAKQFGELAGAGKAGGPPAPGTGSGAAAQERPGARLGLQRLLGTDAAQAQHVAEMLGQFAQNLAKGQ